MSPAQQKSRINLAELKAQIVKKLGPDKARRYFSHLTRLLSHKLSKVEFDKICYLTIGRENLTLHNQFIRSILKNACNGKVPPPLPPVCDVIGPIGGAAKKSPNEEGYQQSSPLNASKSFYLSNGDLPLSPCKGRSVKHDRRLVDRPSPLGPNGRTETVSAHQGVVSEATVPKVAENGYAYVYDLQRPIHHHQGISEQPDKEQNNSMFPPPLKRPRLNRSPHSQLYVNNKDSADVVLEDGEMTESILGGPIRSPLGIPFCSASVGCAHRATSCSFGDPREASNYLSSFESGELLDTQTLRKRMEHIAESEGLHGVTIDCANLLNNGLDAYLKRLIRSCTELARARSRSEQEKPAVGKQHIYGNIAQGINGVLQNHLMQSPINNISVEGKRDIKRPPPISLLDFRIATELNPQQLGDDWPSLLEKISCRSFEEE